MSDREQKDGDETEVYYTYPGLSPAESHRRFQNFLADIGKLAAEYEGFRIERWWYPFDRMAMIVEITFDPSVYGDPVKHERLR